MQPELPLPHFIEIGRDTIVSLPLYDGATLAAPSAGGCTLEDNSGATVATGVVVVSGSVSTYTVLAASTTSLEPSDAYSVTWTLDGVVYRNAAYIVRTTLINVVSTKALTDRLPLLNGGSGSLTSQTDWSGVIAEAWIEVQLRLIELGRRPSLVLQPTALRQVTLFKALELAFEDLGTRAQDDGELLLRAESYRERYQEAWADVSFDYDTDENGLQDDGETASAMGTVWAC